MRVAKYILTAGFALLFLGCQHAILTYSLHREGGNAILFPPTKAARTSDGASSSIAIKRARRGGARIAGCDIANDVISLHWHGETANLSLHSQSFFASADQSPMQIERGMYLDPLLAIEQFRVDLSDRQLRGCLRADESERLRRAIVENLSLPPAVAYLFQLGSYDVNGYFDLTPDFRMQITSPIYREGVAPSPEALMGYETGNYALLSEGPGKRARLDLTSATEVLIGAAPLEKRSLRNELPFSKSLGYFRLLFMADEVSSNRITRAILISADEETKLAKASVRRQVRPDDFCNTLSIADVTCTIFPKNFGVSPELRVRVNGKNAFVRVGGMVQEVLRTERVRDEQPPSLKILRPFRGHLIPIKFDRRNEDVLKLVLLPGDEITF